jgi:hypothetical protein
MRFSALASFSTSASISFLFSNPDWRFYLHNGTLKTVCVNPNKISSKSVTAVLGF